MEVFRSLGCIFKGHCKASAYFISFQVPLIASPITYSSHEVLRYCSPMNAAIHWILLESSPKKEAD